MTSEYYYGNTIIDCYLIGQYVRNKQSPYGHNVIENETKLTSDNLVGPNMCRRIYPKIEIFIFKLFVLIYNTDTMT